MVDPAVQAMTALVCNDADGLTKAAGSILRFLGGQSKKGVRLTDDEDFQDNVNWIKKAVGHDVTITKDFPPMHEHCGLAIGEMKMLQQMDADMKMGMLTAVEDVKNKQEQNGGYISWKDLMAIFESENHELFHPCIDEGVTRNGYAWEKSGLYLNFSGGCDMEAVAKAEKCMQDTVADADIWGYLEINKEVIKNIFGEHGVCVGDFQEIFIRNKKIAHIAIDVGVVRFPRLQDPCFKVYRFRVIVFNSETAITFINEKCAGIFCEFREKKYVMTDEYKKNFTPEISKKVNSKFKKQMAKWGIDSDSDEK